MPPSHDHALLHPHICSTPGFFVYLKSMKKSWPPPTTPFKWITVWELLVNYLCNWHPPCTRTSQEGLEKHARLHRCVTLPQSTQGIHRLLDDRRQLRGFCLSHINTSFLPEQESVPLLTGCGFRDEGDCQSECSFNYTHSKVIVTKDGIITPSGNLKLRQILGTTFRPGTHSINLKNFPDTPSLPQPQELRELLTFNKSGDLVFLLIPWAYPHTSSKSLSISLMSKKDTHTHTSRGKNPSTQSWCHNPPPASSSLR